MSRSLVEQIREMIDVSIDREWHPTSCCDGIIGHSAISRKDERELFTAIVDRIEREYMELPLDADGDLIKPGDKVHFVGGDEPFEVFGYDFEDGELLVHIGRGDRTSTDAYVLPTEITHKQPDTMERIEADARKIVNEYWGCHYECQCCPAIVDGEKPYERYANRGKSCTQAQYIHLLQRQREVLERGQR